MASEMLPDGWRWTTLGDVAAPGRSVVSGPFGSNIGSRFFVDHGVPVIRGNNLTTDMDRFVDDGFVFVTEQKARELGNCGALPRDLVFTAAGSLGQVGLVPANGRFGRYIISNKQLRVRLNTDVVDPLFAYYWFASPRMVEYIRQRNTGSSVPLINLSVLRALPMPLPPLREQSEVIRQLGALDDKIQLNRSISQTLESMAGALFKSWFVDFDPVRAKSVGRDPSLPTEIAELFPDSFCDSEFGEIPCGWAVDSAYRVASVIYGAPFGSALFNNRHEGVPLIRIRDLETHDPQISTLETHPRGYLVEPGDLVVGMDGEFRAHQWQGPSAWLNQRLCCFRPEPGVSRAFVHYSIDTLLEFFERSKTGTTVIHLGKRDIDTFRILVSPPSVLRAFGLASDRLDQLVVCLSLETRNLAALRDDLLPRLIGGDLGGSLLSHRDSLTEQLRRSA